MWLQQIPLLRRLWWAWCRGDQAGQGRGGEEEEEGGEAQEAGRDRGRRWWCCSQPRAGGRTGGEHARGVPVPRPGLAGSGHAEGVLGWHSIKFRVYLNPKPSTCHPDMQLTCASWPLRQSAFKPLLQYRESGHSPHAADTIPFTCASARCMGVPRHAQGA